MRRLLLMCLFFLLILSRASFAQDSSCSGELNKKQLKKYSCVVKKKSQRVSQGIDKSTQKSLGRLMKTESRLKKFVYRFNPSLSDRLFKYSIDTLVNLKRRVKNKTELATPYSSRNYFAYLDTLKQSVSFIHSSDSSANSDEAASAGSPIELAEKTFSSSEAIHEYMKNRQQELQTYLQHVPGVDRQLRHFNDETAGYIHQVNQYKNVFADQAKVEKLVLNSIRKIPAFDNLMKQNSFLSALFPFGGSQAAGGGNIPVVNGIPSRAMLQSALPEVVAKVDLSSHIQQQLSTVSVEADKKKKKETASAKEPIKFKLKYGADLQFAKASNFLPSTGDLSLKVGVELTKKSTAGLGVVYKFGLGKSFRELSLSHQGIGIRSFIDMQIHKSLYLQGGAEWNYNHAFRKIDELKDYASWQPSILMGLSRKYMISKKLKGNVQILFDALYNKHIPTTQPLIFRFGYDLK